MLRTQVMQQEFSVWIQDQVPSLAALQNQEAGDVPCTLPGKEGDTACVSISINKVSFATSASLREPPSLDASRKLFGRFPAEGFLSETEPLLFHYHVPGMRLCCVRV